MVDAVGCGAQTALLVLSFPSLLAMEVFAGFAGSGVAAVSSDEVDYCGDDCNCNDTT